jgi:hypothetical protein
MSAENFFERLYMAGVKLTFSYEKPRVAHIVD